MLSNEVKILIIDDEWLIRSELKSMLMHYSNLNVVGDASNLSDAVQLFNEVKPDEYRMKPINENKLSQAIQNYLMNDC